MAKKFSTKDVKIVSSTDEPAGTAEETGLSADLTVGSAVNLDGKSGSVIWEGHQLGSRKIKVKWDDGSMSFHTFDS